MGSAFTPGWQAGLELSLRQRHNLTRLTHARHWGPLRVQRPFYPGLGTSEGSGECHLYLLHPPGGMVSGDCLQMNIDLAENAHGLLTTPSAGKIYRGNHTDARQKQEVSCRVGDGSLLEWLPQETIVFDGARGELSLRVELDETSSCCLWDIVCLGRPASAEYFTQGFLRQRLALYRNNEPVYVESNHFVGGSALLAEPWGLGGRPVTGSFLVTASIDSEILAALQGLALSYSVDNDMAAVSCVDGLVVIRYLGGSVERCKELFIDCWQQLRPLVRNLAAIEPRIWRT
ncbi:MAG: urease accessory protein UreD [Porticoccaceae bacterium]|nr:urease accessory protein UreD [Porticoccaceae bacterium]